jgi:hypothetical protein
MRNLLSLALLTLSTSCRDPVVPAHGLVVSAVASPATIQASATMNIALSIENTGTETRNLGISGCFPSFEVLNHLAIVVGPGSRVCTADIRPPIPVAPGATYQHTEHWRGESKDAYPSGEPIYLPPGQYFIRPRIQVVEHGWVYGPPIAVTIASPQ